MGEVFVTTQRLRFCDTDRLGHVNNAVYSVMCEAGRSELMQEAGLLEPGSGHAVVIARLELDFLREMNWPGEIRIDTAIYRIGQKSVQVRQHVHQGDTLVAKATFYSRRDRHREAAGGSDCGWVARGAGAVAGAGVLISASDARTR